jgi:hypothetical protein
MDLRFEHDIYIVRKLSSWAENHIDEETDFIDYWYNLFQSQTKTLIDEPDKGNVASFGVARWKNDFETYADKYIPQKGQSFSPEERSYFAAYSQYLVYELQIPSKKITELYGKPMFEWLMTHYNRFHTFGLKLFIQYFAEEWGVTDPKPS